ncbi:MAG: C40 family peptidase [Mycobacteriales bacterium]|nr:NlpC/P60 family protein [Frankia sp.]
MPAVSPPPFVAPRSATTRLLCGLGAAAAIATVFCTTSPAVAAPAQSGVASHLSINPARQTVSSGATAVITSRLTADSSYMPGYPIELWKRSGSSWTYLRSATSDEEGLVRFSTRPTATTVLQTRFAGDYDYAATTSPSVTVTIGSGSSLGRAAVAEAARHAGAPYQYGAAGPSRFDCSGFTRYVFARLGHSLPHNSGQQRSAVRVVAAADRQIGDLVFSHSSNGSVHHVGIYAGNGYMWHSPQTGDVVKKSKIYASRVSYGRVG